LPRTGTARPPTAPATAPTAHRLPARHLHRGWHTFAADWEPGIITWYYDGQNIGCMETQRQHLRATQHHHTSNPMYLILALGSNAANGITDPAQPTHRLVAVYQH